MPGPPVNSRREEYPIATRSWPRRERSPIIAACCASPRLLLIAATAHAQSPDTSDWGYYGGDAFGQRYSSLAEIRPRKCGQARVGLGVPHRRARHAIRAIGPAHLPGNADPRIRPALSVVPPPVWSSRSILPPAMRDGASTRTSTAAGLTRRRARAACRRGKTPRHRAGKRARGASSSARSMRG